jgi:hypothetical protein
MKKRIKTEFIQNPDGTEHVSATCSKCGEPITHSNKYGIFCDKECDLEKSKEAEEKINGFINGFLNFRGK